LKDESDKSTRILDVGREVRSIRAALSNLDRQTVVVLLFSAFAVILQMKLGDRSLFRTGIAPSLGIESVELGSWTWWFLVQGVLGFICPVLILRYGFKRSLKEMGLGLGDWRFASVIGGIYLPVVVLGTWILSDGGSFQAKYPHYEPAALDWSVFFVYEAVFLFYWMGWEYLWRGFVLFGTARVFGIYAIVIQTLPFAILHYEKPLPEALLAIVGGLAIGALVWRSRSFWIAVPIHAVQMLLLDLFSSLRIRTGVSGITPASFLDILEKL